MDLSQAQNSIFDPTCFSISHNHVKNDPIYNQLVLQVHYLHKVKLNLIWGSLSAQLEPKSMHVDDLVEVDDDVDDVVFLHFGLPKSRPN